ncbi:MAG: Holliday junction branch migration protein RuvA [Acidimicrobiales bacterium]
MIGSLRGRLLERSAFDGVLIEAGGVGYRANVPAGVLAGMGPEGSEVFLWVHTHVREDAIILYGFTSADQRRCFSALIGAHGVGPSLALAILGVHSPDELRRCILTGDVDGLTLVPGVGQKTATRLLMELKERFDLPDLAFEAGTPAEAGADAQGEVRAALQALGYEADEVRRALRALPQVGEVDDLLRAALRELASTR